MEYPPTSAIAHPNIAFIKYWGDVDPKLRIPANGSISMNLDQLFTRTTVRVDLGINQDIFYLNNKIVSGQAYIRVKDFLSAIRNLSGKSFFFDIRSTNNFPTGVGIASSASGFASLALAVTKACDLELNQEELSIIARLGSGSACRSIPAGFVEWQAGSDHYSSFATSIAPAEHWDLIDCIVIVDDKPKKVGSTQGHALASSSPLQEARLQQVAHNLMQCRQAILQRDFEKLAEVIELDSNLMHAVMMTSKPPLFYWLPTTLSIMEETRTWRAKGWGVCYTIDAGPNIHLICLPRDLNHVIKQLDQIPGILSIIQSHPGGSAKLE
jgi:diphosphomevalonate decarboxylase